MSDIAGSNRINVSTAHPLLQTLTRRGYAEKNPDTRSYALGPRLLGLGSAYSGHHDLIGAALPRFEELRDKVGETIYRAIYSDGDTVEICTTAGHHEPAHCAATGKVQLAFLPEQGLERFIEHGPLVGRTAKSIIGKAAMVKELTRVREQRYALDDEDLAPGLCCVGVPVSRPSGRVNAAISIAMPKASFQPENVAGWVRLLKETATRISRALGLSNGR